MTDKFTSTFCYKRYCVVNVDKNTCDRYDTFVEAHKKYKELIEAEPKTKFLFESVYPDYTKSTTMHSIIECNYA